MKTFSEFRKEQDINEGIISKALGIGTEGNLLSYFKSGKYTEFGQFIDKKQIPSDFMFKNDLVFNKREQNVPLMFGLTTRLLSTPEKIKPAFSDIEKGDIDLTPFLNTLGEKESSLFSYQLVKSYDQFKKSPSTFIKYFKFLVDALIVFQYKFNKRDLINVIKLDLLDVFEYLVAKKLISVKDTNLKTLVDRSSGGRNTKISEFLSSYKGTTEIKLPVELQKQGFDSGKKGSQTLTKANAMNIINILKKHNKKEEYSIEELTELSNDDIKDILIELLYDNQLPFAVSVSDEEKPEVVVKPEPPKPVVPPVTKPTPPPAPIKTSTTPVSKPQKTKTPKPTTIIGGKGALDQWNDK